MLRAIRNVNQLITREKSRDRLLQSACDNLIETRGYYSVWIALLDEVGGLVTAAEAGLGGDFLPIVERLKRGDLIACGRRALSQQGGVVIEDPLSACADCPLSANCGSRGAMTVRLEHEGEVYGLSSVSIPADFTADEEEQALFEEVAGDIAFALHSIELEERRKRAEEELRLLSSAVEQSTEGIALVDLEGNMLFVNDAFATMHGYTPEKLVGKHLSLFHTPEQMPSVEAANRRIQETGEFSGEIWHVRRDGAVFPTLMRNSLLRDEVGNPIGMIGTMRDITERKQAEEALKEYSQRLEEMVEQRTQELQDAQEQLIRREKLAILGQLAGGVGHELRNPLGVISNAVYFLQMTLADADETTREYLDIVSSEVRDAEKIVSDLLDFSRTRPAEKEEIAVSALVSQVLKRRPPPEDVEVVTQTPSDLPLVFVDPRQMGQVLGNLVTNAYQAMPDGGRLIIAATVSSDLSPTSNLQSLISISITDTGCG
ncbi:MAG: PAS domain S-box protein, partial [Anaerolineae bacterium]|nr:PAS domain S-box protein [Anaerolineae bacterium]